MRKLMIAAALASTAFATPALARDGSAYIGFDAGIMKANKLRLTLTNASGSISDAEVLRHKWGYDVDVVFGYDFGMFRLEGELADKHASINRVTFAPSALTAARALTTTTTFGTDGRDNVLSGMVNALLDLGPSDGLNGSIGLGAGEARVKSRAGLNVNTVATLNYTSEDNAFAWQALAELRVPVTESIDLGLKYRYFQAGKLNFGPFCVTTCTVVQPYHLHGRFKSNSLMASLLFNFGGARAAPPPAPPPPPPPPPPAPATQTCPDGSVIDATATCPAPPPPPPPPPPVQRGERGK
ncbi:MAG: outer membrane protein [Sphingomicrobium sp.]